MDPVAQLEREWQAIAPGALARSFPRWCEHEPALRRFESPRHLLGTLRRARGEEADVPLHALLRLAAHDRAAGRFCLQAILPALKAHAGRIVSARSRREEVWELLFAAAWENVCSYPTNRSRRVAANLVLDVLHDTTRALRRLERNGAAAPAGTTVPLEHAGSLAAPAPARAAGAEGIVTAAVHAGTLEPWEGELILRTRLDGEQLRPLADSLGLPYDALRKRRQRAEARLRARLDADATCPNRAPPRP